MLRNLFNRYAAPYANKVLARLVKTLWTPSPWSNTSPQIIDTEKADIGVGVAMYHISKDGVINVVLLKASNQDKYQIPGGFMNLSPKGDSELEDAFAREVSEELVDENGTPLLDTQSVKERVAKADILDRKIISVRGQPRIVMSVAVKLTDDEFSNIQTHANRIIKDTKVADKIRAATNNEIDGIGIFTLESTIESGNNILRHKDQMSLFHKLKNKITPQATQDLSPHL